MVRYASAHVAAGNPDQFSKSRGEYLSTHFKNMREVSAALNGKPFSEQAKQSDLALNVQSLRLVMDLQGMNLQKAYTYLSDVKEHKQVIPFRRFAGGIGRATQAKQFGTTKGRWPEKSVRFILNLLKNAESNAEAKDLEKDELVIKNIVVQQAPKTRRRTYRAHGRINPYQGHPCHVEVILATPGAEVPRAKDMDVDTTEKKGKGKKTAQIEA